MKSISLDLPTELLKATDRCSRALGITRAEYFRRSIARMNRQAGAAIRTRRIQRAARKCFAADLKVTSEFAALEHSF
jgi:hypothetical protein